MGDPARGPVAARGSAKAPTIANRDENRGRQCRGGSDRPNWLATRRATERAGQSLEHIQQSIQRLGVRVIWIGQLQAAQLRVPGCLGDNGLILGGDLCRSVERNLPDAGT